jgi:hypothetical protein
MKATARVKRPIVIQKTADELHRSGEIEQSRRHLVDER